MYLLCKAFGIDVPTTNKWSACFEFRFQGSWKSHMWEKQCKQGDTHGWEMRSMLFNAMVTQVLLYWIEV